MGSSAFLFWSQGTTFSRSSIEGVLETGMEKSLLANPRCTAWLEQTSQAAWFGAASWWTAESLFPVAAQTCRHGQLYSPCCRDDRSDLYHPPFFYSDLWSSCPVQRRTHRLYPFGIWLLRSRSQGKGTYRQWGVSSTRRQCPDLLFGSGWGRPDFRSKHFD